VEEWTNPRAVTTRTVRQTPLTGHVINSCLLAGWTTPALAGSGVGCGLAGRTRPVPTQSDAASWPSPHMSNSHSFRGPPPSRVPLTYARTRIRSTDFAECAQLRASGIARRRAERGRQRLTSASLSERSTRQGASTHALSSASDDEVDGLKSAIVGAISARSVTRSGTRRSGYSGCFTGP
jgi:hypothetical protein